jgi:hypothetical protein
MSNNIKTIISLTFSFTYELSRGIKIVCVAHQGGTSGMGKDNFIFPWVFVCGGMGFFIHS